MTDPYRYGLRAVRRLICALLLAQIFALMLLAAPAAAAGSQIIVIRNDPGGSLGQRTQMLDRIKAAQARVEIRGDICYSACTLYLGADDVCISPATVFGFHGPRRNGRPLPAAEFEHWSQVMARYYPDDMRQWFLQTARYAHDRIMQLSGADLIRADYARC